MSFSSEDDFLSRDFVGSNENLVNDDTVVGSVGLEFTGGILGLGIAQFHGNADTVPCKVGLNVGVESIHGLVLLHVSFNLGGVSSISGFGDAVFLVDEDLGESSFELLGSLVNSRDIFVLNSGIEVSHSLLDVGNWFDVVIKIASFVAIEFLVVESGSDETLSDRLDLGWGEGGVGGSDEECGDEWCGFHNLFFFII